jgi:hypothetical protein
MNPSRGYNYYRLRSVDRDATFSRSSIVQVRFGTGIMISIRPNPAKDHVNVVTDVTAGFTRITLFDLNGRTVSTAPANLLANQTYRFALNVPKGVYMLRLENSSETVIEKIVIR